MPLKTKQYKIRRHILTILTPKQACLRKSEGYDYQILPDKQKKVRPKFKVNISLEQQI